MVTVWRRVVSWTVAVLSCSAAPGLVAQSLPDDSRSVQTPTAVIASVAAPEAAAPAFTVDLASVNPGADVERSACVTVAIRANLAYECGDLRLSYTLQANLFRNETRAPVLLYNSQHARPTPIVRVAVTPTAAWPGSPLSVTATLRVQQSPGAVPVIRATRTWTGAALDAFTAGLPVQLALSFDALDLATNLYPISVEITMNFGGAPVPPVPPVSGELAIVNRRGSEFGSGWWVAGYERLQRLPNGNLFWVGGDGSTRRYVLQSTTGPRKVYTARTLTGRDSLTEFVDSATFRRHLPRGAFVHFTSTGRHDQTVSSVGAVTSFYSERCTFLSGIAVMGANIANGNRHWWVFWSDGYDLDEACAVYDPSNPSAWFARMNGAYAENYRSIWRLIYPDSGAFLRQSGVGAASDERYAYTERHGRIRTYRDAFGTETRITWDSSGTIDSAVTANGTDPAVVLRFRAGEAAAVGAPVLAHHATTQLVGPRAEAPAVTQLLLGAFGQPTQIVNPLNDTTRVAYAPTFPLLATEVVAPNGYRSTATYDALGRLTERRADGVVAPDYYDIVTQYTWSAAYPDLLLTATDPTGVVTTSEYATIIGQYPVLTSQQTGNVAGGQTYFYYCTADPCRGLVTLVQSAVNGPGSRRSSDTYEYDTYGNLSATQSAGGKRVEYVNDNAYGRRVATRTRIATSPIARWVTDTIVYDVLDRVDSTVTLAAGDGPTLAQSVVTKTEYVGLSAVPRVVRRYANTTLTTIGVLRDSFVYDAIGRVKENFAQGASRTVPERLTYDAAGNVTRRITPTGSTIRMGYDVLNRLRWRAADTVGYQEERVGTAVPPNQSGLPDDARRPLFPRLALGVQHLVVDRDSASFTYDDSLTKTGQLRTANNRASRIARTYYRNGWVQTDTQRLSAVFDTSDFSQHVYGISYVYDAAGRRVVVNHPAQLAAGLPSSQEWTAYSETTGLPMWTRDLFNNGTSFTFDPAGQLTRQSTPGNSRRDFTYTLDGELATDQFTYGAAATAMRPLFTSNGLATNYALQYDDRGKLTRFANSVGFVDTLRNTYTPLGHLQRAVYASRFLLAAGLAPSEYTSDTEITPDALGTQTGGFTTSSRKLKGSFGGEYDDATRQQQFFWYRQDGSGRLDSTGVGSDAPTSIKSRYRYDSAGNVRATVSPGRAIAPVSPGSERVMYYNALQQLVAVDARKDAPPSIPDATQWLHTFDTYRYDALGRRVLARSQRACPLDQPANYAVCAGGFVARTVWDGAQELWEIKMPDSLATLENDTAPIPAWRLAERPGGVPGFTDIMGQFGRVGYVHGGAVDRPLVVVRLGYADRGGLFQPTNVPLQPFPPFALYPQWDMRGEPAFGVTNDGGGQPCVSAQRCAMTVIWGGLYAPGGAAHADTMKAQGWHGSLLADKRESNGLLYRRNRYLDATTGRFTQPDPIGLAGGLSSYGFANGDPVNFSDPFGLCPIPWQNCIARIGPLLTRIGEAVGRLLGRPVASRAVSVLDNVAERTVRFPSQPAQIGHIFRAKANHVLDTPQNRQLLIDVASDVANRIGADKFGNTWSSLTRTDGTQVWVQTRDGVIQNGGINQVARTVEEIIKNLPEIVRP